MRKFLALALLATTAACGSQLAPDAPTQDQAPTTPPTSASDNLADTMASHDGTTLGDAELAIPDPEARPVMQAQVVLDRLGFGPGVIDGEMGMSTQNALRGFQQARGLPVTGKLDDATKQALGMMDGGAMDGIEATRIVRIPADWASLTFEKTPEGAAAQAKMDRLGYQSLDERLAERFHTTIDVLDKLNPGGRPAGAKANQSVPADFATPAAASPTPTPTPTSTPTSTPSESASAAVSKFKPGQLVRVPNIGADRIAPGAVDDPDWQQTLQMLGVGTEQPDVARIVVSKSKDTLSAYDEGGKLVALFTVSSGSSHDPLPLGNWKIAGVAHNPPFAFDPELMWDVPDTAEKQQLPPGPNGPVGVVWIDLSKDHYGIHGTPEPQTIGRAQSHGCVRLTNWDAARLAQMVSTGTKVVFEK